MNQFYNLSKKQSDASTLFESQRDEISSDLISDQRKARFQIQWSSYLTKQVRSEFLPPEEPRTRRLRRRSSRWWRGRRWRSGSHRGGRRTWRRRRGLRGKGRSIARRGGGWSSRGERRGFCGGSWMGSEEEEETKIFYYPRRVRRGEWGRWWLPTRALRQPFSVCLLSFWFPRRSPLCSVCSKTMLNIRFVFFFFQTQHPLCFLIENKEREENTAIWLMLF